MSAQSIAFFSLSDVFDYLDAPPERVCGAEVPMPYSAELEAEAMVDMDNIANAVRRVCYRKK